MSSLSYGCKLVQYISILTCCSPQSEEDQSMRSKTVIVLAPYICDAKSASSKYLINLANGLSEFHDVIFFHQKHIQHLSSSISQRSIFSGWLAKLIGLRLTSQVLLLLVYMSRYAEAAIVDVNPCIGLFGKRLKIYHVIHHINDIPALSKRFSSHKLYREKTYSNLFVKAIWMLMLLFSPKRVITVSQTVSNEISSANWAKDITIIRNINQIEAEFHNLNSRSYPQSFHYDILMIGHNIPRKNYSLAISAINLVQDSLPCPLNVCIVGDNTESLKDSFQTIVRVSLFSQISRDNLLDIIASSRLFVNTSRLEGYCIPFIEAQYLGLSCVVPELSIFHENSFTNDVHYCRHTIDDYTEKLYALLADPSTRLSPTPSPLDLSRYERLSNSRINIDIQRFAALI